MEMTQLRLFVSVAQTLNFSKTAEQFFLTQPAVSHQIKMLEKHLGIVLLQRGSHHVSVTEEGLEFLEYAKQILELSSSAENRMQNITQGRTGRVRIAVLSSSSEYLSECLAAFCRKHPLIQTDVDYLEGPQQIKAISDGAHDFYFAARRMLPEGDKFEYVVTQRESLGFFVHSSQADSIDLDDWNTVKKYPFVSVPYSDTTLYNQIRMICRNRGWKLNVINYFNRAEAIMLSVNAGVGVTILPIALGRFYRLPNVVVLPIAGKDALTTGVIAWAKKPLLAAPKMFQDVVLSLYQK